MWIDPQRTRPVIALALWSLASPAALLGRARADDPAVATPEAARAAAREVEANRILAAYRAFRPDRAQPAVYQLDWVATLREAKARAAPKRRPILLIIVTNSYGDLFSGHC